MRFFRTSPEKLPAAESEMIFSKQDLKQLLLPLLAEQFLVVLIGMMDTIMVSYCGMKAMSGVSLVDGINVLLIGVFSALATGGAVLVSQYLGKKRPDAAKTAAKMLFYVVLLVSLAIMAICLIFRKPLLLTLFGNVEDEVMAASQATSSCRRSPTPSWRFTMPTARSCAASAIHARRCSPPSS